MDAKCAVTMFEEEVQRRVKRVVSKHQPELAKLFGKHLSLKSYNGALQMPEAMYLGQQVTFKGSGVLYFYLAFERDEKGGPSLSASVLFWRERITLLKSLWDRVEAIHPRPANLGVRNDKFWWADSQPSTDWDSCEKLLDLVISGWIELWKMHCLGGLPKLP